MRAIRHLGWAALIAFGLMASPAQAQRFTPLVPPGELAKQSGQTPDAGRRWVFSLGGQVQSVSDSSIGVVTADSNPEFSFSTSLDYFISELWSVGVTFMRDDRDVRLKAGGGPGFARVNVTSNWIDNHVAYHWGEGWSGQVGFTYVPQNIDLERLFGAPASGSINVNPSSWNAWLYKRFKQSNGRHPINYYVGGGYHFNNRFNSQGLYGLGAPGFGKPDGAASLQGGLSYRVGKHLDLNGSLWAFDIAGDVTMIGNLSLSTRLK